jgi:hypothetical protein
LILRAVENITWIKVEKPSFDIIGLVLGALTLTGVLAVGAFVLGVVLGVTFIRRRARRPQPTTLHLDTAPAGRGTPA